MKAFIKISNEDIQAEVIAQIKQMPSKQKEIIEYYKNNPSIVESLKGKIIEDM